MKQLILIIDDGGAKRHFIRPFRKGKEEEDAERPIPRKGIVLTSRIAEKCARCGEYHQGDCEE